jgi:hypothetical protein
MRLFSGGSSAQKEDGIDQFLIKAIELQRGTDFRIWKHFPSYKDIQIASTLERILLLGVMTNFFLISLVLITSDVMLSITISIILLILFIFAFSDSFHFRIGIHNLIHGKDMHQIYPFEKITFWMNKEHNSTIYLTNKKDLISTGLKIYKIEVMPGNIHPGLNSFIKGLYSKQIPFTYQVVQKPLDYLKGSSYKLEVYFCVFFTKKGFLTQAKMDSINNKLDIFSISIDTNIKANLHHFKIVKLKKKALVRALNVFSLNHSTQETDLQSLDNSESTIDTKKSWRTLLKLFTCILYIILTDSFLLTFNLEFLFIIVINLGLILAILGVFWREAFFFKVKTFLEEDGNTIISPFDNLRFYVSDKTLYIKDREGLIGTKAFTLKYIKPEIYDRKGRFFNRTERLFRVLLSQKAPFTYTIHSSPISFDMFKKEGLKYLKNKEKQKVEVIANSQGKESWMESRGGMWRMMLTMTASAYTKCNELNDGIFQKTWKKVRKNEMILKSSFQMNMSRFSLEQVKKGRLPSALLSTTQKHKFFTLNGTRLNYLLLQGKSLTYLVELSDEFKRGVKTKLASEFTTPLYLENQITFGKTINTEHLTEEVSAGLKLDQSQRLLITGHNHQDNSMLAMKVVSELIKSNRKAIIFDFNGDWSRLIRSFSESPFFDSFLYFKLGKNFRVNPIYSDIPYDQNNLEYLDYMFDSYALAFRQNKRMVENLKELIKSNEELDLPSLALKMENQKEWEKNSMTQSAISLFKDFSERVLVFSGQGEDEKNRITCSDFLSTNKTIILDFSELRDLQQKLFLAFIVISKMIHYVKYVNNFVPKTIIIPNIDLFFDKWYLDKVSNYGKITSFLDPLTEKGFGLIFMLGQINKTHPNLLSRFPNMLSFRANTDEEIRILKNFMNLRDLLEAGFYSSKRKDAYQVHYLKTLPNDQVLMTRSDVDQTFPVKISWEKLKLTSKMTDEELRMYMKERGFNIELSEEAILNCTKKNLFEKDLGDYSVFTDQIITFLKGMKVMHNVGNLYKTKLKEELKKIIYPKAATLFQKNRRKIMAARDNILDLLIKHEYIKEAHPEKASGAQTIRTSYKVSKKFDEACEDYTSPTDDIPEIIEDEFTFEDYPEGKNDNILDIQENIASEEAQEDLEDITPDKMTEDQEESGKSEENEEDFPMDEAFRNGLVRSIGQDLIYSIAKLDKFLKEETYEDSVHFQRQIIPNFLLTLSTDEYDYRDVDLLTSQEIEEMLLKIIDQRKFPFDMADMRFFMERLDLSEISDSKILRERTKENYELLKEILKKVQLTLYGRYNHAD